MWTFNDSDSVLEPSTPPPAASLKRPPSPLSCRCWPPSSAAPPASWLVRCWPCYCSPSVRCRLLCLRRRRRDSHSSPTLTTSLQRGAAATDTLFTVTCLQTHRHFIYGVSCYAAVTVRARRGRSEESEGATLWPSIHLKQIKG